jgi:imidazoleglycerol-phosphate dehydratase/histidinol-phosphatase
MFEHFFKSFTDAARCNLHISVDGKNDHHKAEAIFKAFARVLKDAASEDPDDPAGVPSTKGSI